jgi:outer membrane protein assembly factor BamB
MSFLYGIGSGPLAARGAARIACVSMCLLAAFVQAVAHGQATASETKDSGPQADLKKNWPSFRGFGSNGHATNATPPMTWGAEESHRIVWKTPIPKQGMSSPVVFDDRVFLTGADETSREVICFHAQTGKLLWQHDTSDIPGASPDGELPRVLAETGFAAPTPTTNGQYIAAIFATGELVCLTMKGERAWARHLGTPDNAYGHASSLVCSGNLLFVQYDQPEDGRLFAFDMATGNPAWEVVRDEASWSSPILVENKKRTELILVDNKAVCSYDPKTGERFWRVECLDGEIAPSPAYSDGKVFVAVEYSAASAIDVGKHGKDPTILWQWDEALPDTASPVANKDFVILSTAFGSVTCLDAKTGRVCWEHEFDRGFSSSPILVNDRVYQVDLSGGMQVFKMSSEFELLGSLELGEAVYATPAFVGGKIYVRGMKHLICIGPESE